MDRTGESVERFLDAIEDARRREDARTLMQLMREATGEEPAIWGPSIVGFGSYHYAYESGREGDTVIVGFSPRTSATALYGLISDERAPELLAKLGKHKQGKGCL